MFGDAGFFIRQIAAVLAVLAFGFIVSFALAKLVDAVIGLRATAEQEFNGLDISLHEERAYALSEQA
jgi:Amt family ammonium transporter